MESHSPRLRIQSAVWKSEALSGFAKSWPALCAYQFLAFVQAQLAEGGAGRVIHPHRRCNKQNSTELRG